MSANKLSTIISAILLSVTILVFAYLVADIQLKTPSTKNIDEKYKTVDIESIKNDALNLLSERQNISGIPISVPLQKMGKENPFSGM